MSGHDEVGPLGSGLGEIDVTSLLISSGHSSSPWGSHPTSSGRCGPWGGLMFSTNPTIDYEPKDAPKSAAGSYLVPEMSATSSSSTVFSPPAAASPDPNGYWNDPILDKYLSWLFDYMLNQVQSGRMYLSEVMQKFPLPKLSYEPSSVQDIFINDSKKRFLVTISTTSDLGRSREVVVLNDQVLLSLSCFEVTLEAWRSSIDSTLRENARLNKVKEMESSKVGSLCHRPKELPIAYKLLSVVEHDPQKRFVVRRSDNLIWIRCKDTTISRGGYGTRDDFMGRDRNSHRGVGMNGGRGGPLGSYSYGGGFQQQQQQQQQQTSVFSYTQPSRPSPYLGLTVGGSSGGAIGLGQQPQYGFGGEYLSPGVPGPRTEYQPMPLPAPAVVTSSSNVATQISELYALVQRGILSEQEFAETKKKIISQLK